MKISSKILFLIFILLLFESCSSTKYYMNKNKHITVKQINKIYKQNGNVYYLYSTYSNNSNIWTYSENRMIIYLLKNGRINNKQVFYGINAIDCPQLSINELRKDLYSKCALELDGDCFGFMISVAGDKREASFYVGINCLKHVEFESCLLNRIVGDINKYGLWSFDYTVSEL